MGARQGLAKFIKFTIPGVTHAISTNHWLNGLPQPQTVQMFPWRRAEFSMSSQKKEESDY